MQSSTNKESNYPNTNKMNGKDKKKRWKVTMITNELLLNILINTHKTSISNRIISIIIYFV